MTEKALPRVSTSQALAGGTTRTVSPAEQNTQDGQILGQRRIGRKEASINTMPFSSWDVSSSLKSRFMFFSFDTTNSK